VEQWVVIGPRCGDAVSVEKGAGAPDAEGPGDNVVVASEIKNAKDKGVKVSVGGYATIERSCVHDNHNGGLQSTLGGHVVASENVVQHNVPGSSQNGLVVGVTGNQTPADRSTLETNGNVVRFSGGGGLAVVNDATADFHNHYVADSQFGGSTVRTTAEPPVG